MLRQIYADAVDVGPCYGSTQRSPDDLAGGEEACSECCPLSKNLDPGLSYLAISPPFFSSIPSFVFLKISPAMFFWAKANCHALPPRCYCDTDKQRDTELTYSAGVYLGDVLAGRISLSIVQLRLL